VVLGGGGTRIVHDAEVHDGRDLSGSHDVLELLAPQIDLRVLDVLRLVGEGPAVDAEHEPVAMEPAREPSAEPAADACDEHAPFLTEIDGNEVRDHQKMLFLALSPRFSID